MRRSRALVVCGILAAVAAGCSGAYDNPIQPESAPAAAPPTDSQATLEPENKPAQPEAAQAKPAVAGSEPSGSEPSQPEDRGKPAPRTSPRSPSSPPNETPIQLSAGVALPQSLPTGTSMGFSVDYKFVVGPGQATEYFWVIQPAKGKALRQPARLKAQGTLQGFVPELRPENGPFQTYIEAKDGTRLSKPCPLR